MFAILVVDGLPSGLKVDHHPVDLVLMKLGLLMRLHHDLGNAYLVIVDDYIGTLGRRQKRHRQAG